MIFFWFVQEERDFIAGSHMKLEHKLNKKLKVPWRDILVKTV